MMLGLEPKAYSLRHTRVSHGTSRFGENYGNICMNITKCEISSHQKDYSTKTINIEPKSNQYNVCPKTFVSHRVLRWGETLFLQIGQERHNCSHISMHSMWKQCSHLDKHPTVSLLAYSDKQIEHIISFLPGSFIFPFNSTLLYNSRITDSAWQPRGLPIASRTIERRISVGSLSELNMRYAT